MHDPQAAAYLEELGSRLEQSLGERLMCAAAVGSWALGAYDPKRSDLDVIVIVDKPLTVSDWDNVVDLCSHESLPCPARKLELVAYTRPQVAAPRRAQRWELNLNTGRGVRHAGYDPMAESWHWFVLDLAQARVHAVPLVGEHPKDLIGEVSAELIADAHAANVTWHAVHEADHRMVLAAARAARWHAKKDFVSKTEAWEWARKLTDKQYPPAKAAPPAPAAPAPASPPAQEPATKPKARRGLLRR